MGTIRTALSASAALIALMAIVPAASQAQAPKAPLQVVPPADQAQPSTRAGSKKKATKATAKTTSDTSKTAASSPRQNADAIQPSSKTARTNARTAAAVPVAAAPPIAQPKDNVMRGGDSISLIARLPWWRNDRMQPVSYGSAEAKNQVLAAADAWFAANGGEAYVHSDTGESFALASEEEALADAGAVDDIEPTAAAPVPAPPSPTFLQSLLAILGGAAAAAASARFLFT